METLTIRPEHQSTIVPIDREKPLVGHERASFSPKVVEYFDGIAENYEKHHRKMGFFIENTTKFLKSFIPENKKVLMIGCLAPEILDNLKPNYGVGIDVSSKLVSNAVQRNRNSKIQFHCSLPENFQTSHKFDYIVLLNVADYTDDFFILAESLGRFTHADTRIISSMLNPLWYAAARWASMLKIRIPDTPRNLIANQVFSSALQIKGFRTDQTFNRVLVPKNIPFVSWFCNQFLARLPGLNSLCFMKYISSHPVKKTSKELSCSVIVPCYNEEENVRECVQRIPKMGTRTEIVVVNDGSTDKTKQIASAIATLRPDVKLVSHFPNRGKGRAVLAGIQASSCDVVMICDADMTVPPEELPEFFEAIDRNEADFVSGTRFLYPMHREAMRVANYFGNILFSKLVQLIAGSPCSDSLCGTKAMRRADFKDLVIEDPKWGDFDLIFHAAKKKLRGIQLPVHYKNRIYGESKMRAFHAAASFFRLCFRKWAELP